MKIKFILSGLDGVIRHCPPNRDQMIEHKHGLPEGKLSNAAQLKFFLLMIPSHMS